MNAVEIFEQHGLQFHDSEHAMLELSELDVDELWTLTERLIGEEMIGISSCDEDVQASILRLTLVEAFTNNTDIITQHDIDLAQEKALSLLHDIEDADVDASSDVAEVDASSVVAKSEPLVKNKGRRRRTSVSRELVKTLVSADPSADRDTVIAQVMSSNDVDVSEATAIMYFYDVRKELGLNTNGKRGRKPTNTLDRVIQLLNDNSELKRADLIDLIVSELGYKKNTATVYYHNAIKAMKKV